MGNSKKHLNDYAKWYAKTIKGRYGRMYISARQRNIHCDITYKQYQDLIIEANCYYCGGELNYSGCGLDRIDPSEGYILENVVPCCRACNVMKQDSALDSFLLRISKIYDRHINKSKPPKQLK